MAFLRTLRQVHDNLFSFGARVTAAKVMRRLRNRLRRPPGLNDLPRSMHIETAMCCNLDCEYCVLRREWRGEKLMSPARFRQLGPYLRGLDALCLSGLAEPLMNPHLGECIRFVRETSLHTIISIMSNCTLLDQRWCDTLVESGLHTLGFSIDAADEAVNAAIRRGSERASVLDNVKRLIATKRRLRSQTPDIFAITVLQRKNYRELPAVAAAVASAGVRRLEVNTMEPFDAALVPDALLAPQTLSADLAAVLEETARVAAAHRLHLRVAAFAPSRPSCYRSDIPLILANGDVTACSVLAYDRDSFFAVDESGGICRRETHAARRLFGNVFSRPFEEIWRDPDYRAFRDAVRRGRFPPECRDCLIKHDVVCVSGSGRPARAISDIRAYAAAAASAPPRRRHAGG